MAKHSITHFFVQSLIDGTPAIVYHTHDVKTNEFHYKLMDRKKAKALIEAEKKFTPQIKFRIVKCVETYDSDQWV